MKARAFDPDEILKACQAGNDFALIIAGDDLLRLRTWANRNNLCVKKTSAGAIVTANKELSKRAEILGKLAGNEPFTVSGIPSYIRNIISTFNKKQKPATPWKVKKLQDKEFMIYSEPAIPNPQLL